MESALINHLLATARPGQISSVFVPADNDDLDALDAYRAVGGAAEAVTTFTFGPQGGKKWVATSGMRDR